MSIPIGFAHAFRNDAASTAMGVDAYITGAGELEFRQTAAPRLVEDPCGRSIATFGAMIDTCLGAAVFRDPAEERFFVMSRISLSVGAPVPLQGDVHANSYFHHFDERRGFGLTTAVLHHADATLAHVTCRAVAVDVPSGMDPVLDAADFDRAAISSGVPRLGQLVSLGVSVGRDRHDPAVFGGEWVPTEWMLNFRGTVQGGVVVASAIHIAESVGAEVGAGESATLADIDVSILRSPRPHSAYRIAAHVIRRGRRLAVLHITISDENSIPLIVSTAHLAFP